MGSASGGGNNGIAVERIENNIDDGEHGFQGCGVYFAPSGILIRPLSVFQQEYFGQTGSYGQSSVQFYVPLFKTHRIGKGSQRAVAHFASAHAGRAAARDLLYEFHGVGRDGKRIKLLFQTCPACLCIQMCLPGLDGMKQRGNLGRIGVHGNVAARNQSLQNSGRTFSGTLFRICYTTDIFRGRTTLLGKQSFFRQHPAYLFPLDGKQLSSSNGKLPASDGHCGQGREAHFASSSGDCVGERTP